MTDEDSCATMLRGISATFRSTIGALGDASSGRVSAPDIGPF
jgi:hypothetical protein